jgi:hypothetical protein
MGTSMATVTTVVDEHEVLDGLVSQLVVAD